MRRKSSNNRDNDKTAVDCDALSTATLSTKVVLSIYLFIFIQQLPSTVLATFMESQWMHISATNCGASTKSYSDAKIL